MDSNLFDRRVTAGEFTHPDRMDPELVRGLVATRDWLQTPMYFTLVNGHPRHPHGDAVAPDATSHASNSLHKWGIDHEKSTGTALVADGTILGLAQDWDCGIEDPVELFDCYLRLEKLNLWSGIGLYPFWGNPGFHTDLRRRDHPKYGGRWFRDREGGYHGITWKTWKAVVA